MAPPVNSPWSPLAGPSEVMSHWYGAAPLPAPIWNCELDPKNSIDDPVRLAKSSDAFAPTAESVATATVILKIFVLIRCQRGFQIDAGPQIGRFRRDSDSSPVRFKLRLHDATPPLRLLSKLC